MPALEPGRVCVKIAGREAGKHCAVLEMIDANYVLIEGPEMRRRKANIAHLESLNDMVDPKGDVKQQLAGKYNIKVREKRKAKKAEKKEKPVKVRGIGKGKKGKK